MKISLDHVPSTMEEAVEILEKSLTAEDREAILANSAGGWHFGGGMHIRNLWSFWDDTPLRRDSIKRWGIAFGDDLSGMLWEWVTANVKKQPFDIKAYIARVQNHWKEFDTTSCGAALLTEDGNPL